MKKPGPDDYFRIYKWHGLESGRFVEYIQPEQEDNIRTAFEQVAELMKFHCPFNESLPHEFLQTMRAYRSGNTAMVEHFDYSENRAHYLSDFFDYLRLTHRSEGS